MAFSSDTHETIIATPSAAKWLSQFEESDRPTAEMLLQHLEFVPAASLERGIADLIDVNSLYAPPPVALFPVRETDDNETYFPVDPAIPPEATPSAHGVGSEGTLAYLITRLVRAREGAFLAHPSLAEMRFNRCRQAFLVDDAVGSGKRMKRFLEAFCRHPTIKSWVSFHWINPVAVAYCATKKGRDRLFEEGNGRIRRVVQQVDLSQARPDLSPSFLRDVKWLCLKYARKANIKGMRLGAANQITLLVFEHGCSNLAPAILWSRGRDWFPLFPNRTVPSDLAPFFANGRQKSRAIAATAALGHPKLASGDALGSAKERDRLLLMVIAAASKKLRDPDRIGRFVDATRTEVDELLAQCRSRGWLTDQSRLTDLGRGELRRAKMARLEKNLPALNDQPYYPQQLRAAME